MDKAFFNHMEEASRTVFMGNFDYLVFKEDFNYFDICWKSKTSGHREYGEVQRLFFFSAGTPPSRLLGLG